MEGTSPNSAIPFSENKDVSVSNEKTQKARSSLTIMRGVFKCSNSRAVLRENIMIALDELAVQSQHFTVVFVALRPNLFTTSISASTASQCVRSKHKGSANQTSQAFIQPTHCVLFLSNYTSIPCKTQWNQHKQKSDIPMSGSLSIQPERERGRVCSCVSGGCVSAEQAFSTQHYISFHK